MCSLSGGCAQPSITRSLGAYSRDQQATQDGRLNIPQQLSGYIFSFAGQHFVGIIGLSVSTALSLQEYTP
jgi:hypothetical protein